MSEKEYHTAEFFITYSVCTTANKNNTDFFLPFFSFFFFSPWSVEDVLQF